MELRCVIAVIRHGDRTPKQKMKMAVLHPLFFQLFEKYNGPKTGQLKLKHPGQLQEVLEITRTLLKELDDNQINQFPNSPETKEKLLQLKQVLELYRHFSGINRKIQLKYLPKASSKKSSSDDEIGEIPSQPSLLLVVKWGGQLTQTGKNQAEALGKAFRKMYPDGQDAGGDRPDVDLFSTFRHDLKIYASDEGRVQMTAAAFAKGLLALDGELKPILTQMVKSANTNGLLDNDVNSIKKQERVKQKLHDLLAKDRQFNQEDYDIIVPTRSRALISSMDFIKNPVTICRKIFEYIHEMILLIQARLVKGGSDTLYHSETWDLCLRRWLKLEKDFYDVETDKFNISKVPDIYDTIKYDVIHNKNNLQFPYAEDLYVCSKALADIVVPQEYGMTVEEKMYIARGTITPLLRKIRDDLQYSLTSVPTHDEDANKLDSSYSNGIQTPDRHIRTRLYFTSESHVHSLLTAIRYGGLLDISNDEQWKRSMEYLDTVSELNYLTQIVIMLYEDSSEEEDSEKRFHVELHFSPGAYGCFDVLPEIDSVCSSINDLITSDNQNSSGMMITQSSEQIDSADLNSDSASCSNNPDINYLLKPRSSEDDILDLKLNYTPPTSIFSTRVISGTNPTSVFHKLLERKQAGIICSENAVVAPLETLNTNLNYKILDHFIGKMTDLSLLINKNNINNLNSGTSNIPTTLIPSGSTNQINVESVDGTFEDNKNSHVEFGKFTQYALNIIIELPERTLDEH